LRTDKLHRLPKARQVVGEFGKVERAPVLTDGLVLPAEAHLQGFKAADAGGQLVKGHRCNSRCSGAGTGVE
jgi:hypothetical protein